MSFRVKFDQKLFPLEREFPDFGPRESVDFGKILEDQDPHVRYGQI